METASELSERIKTADFVLVVYREDGTSGGGWLGEVMAEDLRWAQICLDELGMEFDDLAFGVGDDDGSD